MSVTVPTYQPRYLAYCQAHGMTPEAMDAHDEERFPGGCMTGYILWIGDRWAEWAKVNGRKDQQRTAADHASFDAWLSSAQVREAA